MRNEETLRKALSLYEQLRDLSYDMGYYSACAEKTEDKKYESLHTDAIAKRNKLTRKMAAALDATAGDTEMDQLRKWIESEQKYYTVNDDGSVTDYSGAYGTILDRIRTKFGYGEKP